MSGRKLTKEQERTFQTIIQGWKDEVGRNFEAHKGDEIDTNRLDGSQTWELAAIERKYKKKINKDLGMVYYADVAEIEKSNHISERGQVEKTAPPRSKMKKFSDIIMPNPNGFPAVPGRK